MKPTAMPSFQIGIWRRSSGVRDAFCRSASVSRTRRLAASILLMNRKRGMSASSSSRSTSSSAGILRSSASQTTTAASQAGITVRMSCANSTEPGQSTKVKVSPRNLQVATFGSTLIAWARASALASPTMLPVVGAPGALDRSGALEDGFEEGGLAALERAHDGDAPRTRIWSAVCHDHSSSRPGAFSRALDRECSASPAAMASPRKPRRNAKRPGVGPAA